MAIKNYTSTVDVYTSLGEIQGALAKHGARQIIVSYDGEGRPQGVLFTLEGGGGLQGFSLPAPVDGTMNVFAKQKIKTDRNQAERTAWRNVRDWVLAQLALVESCGVDMEEVFFPYLTDKKGNTVYQIYTQGRLLLEG